MNVFRTAVALCLVLTMLVSTGCANLFVGNSFNGLTVKEGKENVAHYSGSSSGLYLLWIPLITGNTDDPTSFIPAFGRDTASLDEVLNMVSREARADSARMIVDIQSSAKSYWMPWFFVLFWKSSSLSATGVK